VSEHLPEHLIGTETQAWCRACNRMTWWTVVRVAVGSHAGKPGHCLEHGPRATLTKAQAERRRKQRQGELFT
jgi:hypothetical protein